jgi:CubicO group peptidase (beta-lactamase class C family)
MDATATPRSSTYVPPAGDEGWERITPQAAGFDPVKLADAVSFSLSHETAYCTREGDMEAFLLGGGMHGAPEPEGLRDIVGPTLPRGGTNGVVIRHGKIVAEWGDTRRVDMTFSCTKSYLSTVMGLGWDDRLVDDLEEPVRAKVRDGGFQSAHNSQITWTHLLQQCSEWQGELWSKPDSVDHNRAVNVEPTPSAAKGTRRELRRPGTFYEYNDVRVNRLSLSVMRLLQRPLPEVLRQRIMDSIGATQGWSWNGYSTSHEQLADGSSVQGVSGGGHWGGGLFISTRDHARFGLLMARGGAWGGMRLVSKKWVELATAPSPTNYQYGFMWWLNASGDRGQLYPAAPASAFAAQGAGGNYVLCVPSLDLVVVVRWCGDFRGLTAKIFAALIEGHSEPNGAVVASI